MENPEFNYGQMIACSADSEIRYKGSSGGAISTAIKYLFDNRKIHSAVSFRFNGRELFLPELVYSFDEYRISGSIYHEIGLHRFLKDNLDRVRSPVAVTTLPCQAISIRTLLDQHNMESYLLACTCSAQMSREATYYLLRKSGIDPSDVTHFKYRGDGWPSGLRIETGNGRHFFSINDSLWYDVFNSHIFTLGRCFRCRDTFGLKADLSFADPWLPKYVSGDRTGHSIIMVHTEKGDRLVAAMEKGKYITRTENLSPGDVLASQLGTLRKKYVYLKYPGITRIMRNIITHRYYIRAVNNYNLESFHQRLVNKIIRQLFRISPDGRANSG
jgi:coenzyme F420 hydrogenase subunit beta